MLTPLAPADGNAILPIEKARAALSFDEADAANDARIIRARDGAIDFAEGYTGKALSRRQFEWTLDRFTSVIRLPIVPVVGEGAAISYYGADGVDTSLEEGSWYFGRDSLMAAHGRTWPAANGAPGNIRITFTAGYATPADIPPMLMSGVIVAMAAMFEDAERPDLTAAMRCLDRHRVPSL